MNLRTPAAAAVSRLTKADPTLPALIVTGRETISVRAGTCFGDMPPFAVDTPIPLPADGLEAGQDYAVIVAPMSVSIERLTAAPTSDACLGGFHFAPGGNATAIKGGDTTPAINPHSLWDLNFRPACADPRGMTLVEGPRGKFWCDIYLLGIDHIDSGTSRFDVTIADGSDLPRKPGKGKYKALDYETATAIMAHHGKGLLSLEEFFAAAYGVTERSAHSGDPCVTKLDAARTSRFGLMQATGNLWVWGHDGHPDEPRSAILGGSWWGGGGAGSRYAFVGHWPEGSDEYLGARGRSDHLQLA